MKSDNSIDKENTNFNKDNTNFYQQVSEENSEGILVWGDHQQRFKVVIRTGQEPVNTTIKRRCW